MLLGERIVMGRHVVIRIYDDLCIKIEIPFIEI